MSIHPRDARSNVPAPIVAIVGWLVPGAGYWMIGQRARGIVIGVTILTLFILGLLLSGIRVIDVPGYDDNGYQVRLNPLGQRLRASQFEWRTGRWALLSPRGFVSEIAAKPWFVPQFLTGPVALISAGLSVQAAQQAVPRVHARLADIGTLYTAIAGMLNLMVMIDAAHRAARGED